MPQVEYAFKSIISCGNIPEDLKTDWIAYLNAVDKYVLTLIKYDIIKDKSEFQ